MKSYKIISLTLLLGIVSLNAFAAGLSNKVDYSKELKNIYTEEQQEFYKAKKVKHTRINWDDELRLSEEQKVIVKNIMQSSHNEIDEQVKIIENAHKKINEIHQQDDDKIRAILTPQQQSKFDKIKQKMQKKNGFEEFKNRPSRKKMRQL